MNLTKIGSINITRDVPISLRCYTGNYKSTVHYPYNENVNNGMVLTLATETTSDQLQTLTFGSAAVWINGTLYKICLFHDDNLNEKKVGLIKQVGDELQQQKNCTVLVMTKSEFVTNVFYPYIYEARAKCVGFDLPYELSRLASSWTTARKIQDAFSMKLVENNPRLPSIRIKSINSNAAFIQFVTPLRTKSEKKKIPTHKVYRGYFLDLKTLGYAMSNDSFDGMNNLAKTFGVDTNLQNKNGITKDTVRNNVEKTLVLHKLYCKIISVLQDTFLVKPIHANQLYSPASIGKLYLEKLGIKPFLQKNPDFPKNVIGHLLSAYFGGRVETKIRKKPTRVTYLDFTSTYSSLFSLMDMYSFLIAEKIDISHTKKETQKFLDEITLKDISEKNTWKKFAVICKIRPDGRTILPVRSTFEQSRKAQNIGINHLESTDGTSLWYTLSDVISSKLLSGTTPTIEDAISFTPVGIQNDLPDENIEILKGVTVNPRKENFIKRLIRKRLEIKQNTQTRDDFEKTIENTIKIISNTVAYGIYIQINSQKPQMNQNDTITVYGVDEKPFFVNQNTLSKKEIPAKHFNPILGVFMPSAARLLLAASENIITSHKDGYFAYIDTDSLMVSPKYANEIKQFFQKLNPYSFKNVQMLKTEKDDNGELLENVLFYGISSKKYVLYELDESNSSSKITIYKNTMHGMGHLLDIDATKLWHDILEMHYFPDKKQEILSRYDHQYCISPISITTPNILKRFSRNNEMIRPFNRLLLGTGCKTVNNNMVIPTIPYTVDAKKRELAQYASFTDYLSGKTYPHRESDDSAFYWKPLSAFLEDYTNSPEVKSKGDVGLLKRLHIKFDRNTIQFIGKEVSNIFETNIIGITNSDDSACAVYPNIEKIIIQIRPKDAYKIGISRSNLISLKKKIRDKTKGVALKLHRKTIEKIIAGGSIMARGGEII